MRRVSIEQARIVYQVCPGRTRIDLADIASLIQCYAGQRSFTLPTNTTAPSNAGSSNGRTAMGLVGCPVGRYADEPGAWETVGGQLLFDATRNSKRKTRLSAAKSLYIGTHRRQPWAGWWQRTSALGKSGQGRAIKCLQGDRAKWDRLGVRSAA